MHLCNKRIIHPLPKSYFLQIHVQMYNSASGKGDLSTIPCIHCTYYYKYSDDSLIRTRLFSVDISGLTSFPVNCPSFQKRKSVSALFVWISEISGLLEPGLMSHHCIVVCAAHLRIFRYEEITCTTWNYTKNDGQVNFIGGNLISDVGCPPGQLALNFYLKAGTNKAFQSTQR